MKKTLLALAVSSVVVMASDTTINATMSLMTQGMKQVQSGLLQGKKAEVVKGIDILEGANSIFKNVDVTTFIPNNKKVQVTKNINENLTSNLKALRKAVEAKNYTDATKLYGEAMSNCIACHTTVRGW